jgi:hypothetical protein
LRKQGSWSMRSLNPDVLDSQTHSKKTSTFGRDVSRPEGARNSHRPFGPWLSRSMSRSLLRSMSLRDSHDRRSPIVKRSFGGLNIMTLCVPTSMLWFKN